MFINKKRHKRHAIQLEMPFAAESQGVSLHFPGHMKLDTVLSVSG
jgi:hypothetical protein